MFVSIFKSLEKISSPERSLLLKDHFIVAGWLLGWLKILPTRNVYLTEFLLWFMLLLFCSVFSGDGKTLLTISHCECLFCRDLREFISPTVICAMILISPSPSVVLSVLGLKTCALEQSLSQNYRFGFFFLKAYKNLPFSQPQGCRKIGTNKGEYLYIK